MKEAEGCRVCVLAGGEGTRLRPLTLTRPKPMIPLGPRPVIEHLLAQMAGAGFSDFVLTVNYLKEQVMIHLGDGSPLGVSVKYAVEPEGAFLGTAGSVKLAGHMLDQTFVVLQADAFTTVDLGRAVDFHRRSRADVTIILKEVPDPWLYGVAVCDLDGRITAFQEKPQMGEELSDLVSTGMYCMEPDVLDFVATGECDFAKDVFPKLLREGKRLFGFICEDFWVDIGSLNGYLEGTREVLKREIQRLREAVLIGKDVDVDETVSISGPALIEDGVSIAKSSKIGPYVVLKEGVKVGEDSLVENAAILEGAELGSICKIRESVVGERASLGRRVVADGSIIGPGSTLEESVHVKNGSRVWPGVRVASNTSVEGTLALPTDKPFYFYSDMGKYIGVTASTIYDLVDVLKKVEIASVEFHLYRRDFERWIRDVFQANVLAEKLYTLRKEGLRGEELRRELITGVEGWIEYSTKRDGT